MKEKISNYSKKLVRRYILKKARYEIWDQLSLGVTKFRTYLEVVQEELETENESIFKCETMNQELKNIPI